MTAIQIVDDFILENLPQAPLHRQIMVAEAMATLAGRPAERKAWDMQVSKLKQVQSAQDQLWFNFRKASQP